MTAAAIAMARVLRGRRTGTPCSLGRSLPGDCGPRCGAARTAVDALRALLRHGALGVGPWWCHTSFTSHVRIPDTLGFSSNRSTGLSSVSHYLTPPVEVRALGLAVTGVGRISGQRQARVGRTLTGYAGVLLTEGTGTLELHGRPGRHELSSGSFFWLPPGVAHTYGLGPQGWAEYWILVEGPAAVRYEETGYLGGGPVAVRPADHDATRARLEGLLDLAGCPESLD